MVFKLVHVEWKREKDGGIALEYNIPEGVDAVRRPSSLSV